jgi:hypothetical protein
MGAQVRNALGLAETEQRVPFHPARTTRLRAARVTDGDAVVALLVKRDIADHRAPDITLEDVHDQWRRSDFDLSADARMAETADGQIVGYAAMTDPMILVVVAADQERRGIGSRLRRWAEGGDRARGSARHHQPRTGRGAGRACERRRSSRAVPGVGHLPGAAAPRGGRPGLAREASRR